MRIAFCLEQCLSPVPGGTGRYSKELASAVARIAPNGSVVTGWTALHRNLSPAKALGVCGPRTFPLPRRALIAAWERQKGPKPQDADLIHAPTLLFPPRRDVPLVVTIHDAVPWTHPETLTHRGVIWHRRMAELAQQHADRIIVPTHAVANELTEWLPRISERTTVIGEGVSEALRLPPDAAERARLLGLPTSGYLLSLATLEPRKGLDVLLAALAASKSLDIPLVIVGQPGWGGVDPQTRAVEVGLPLDRLMLFGKISDPDLAVVLNGATALVVPSRAEGFGLPVLEAMAAGTPVITSDAPALVEVGGGATMVAPRDDPAALADVVERVVTDADLRGKLAELGLARSAEFSWKAAAASLWCVYEELISGRA